MLCETAGKHVGENAGHDGGAQHVVKALQAFAGEMRINVKEKIIHVLHRHLKVLQPQFVRQSRAWVELIYLYWITNVNGILKD